MQKRFYHGLDSFNTLEIGRLSELQGPHRNKDDVNLTDGNGSLFLGLEGRFIGLGHAVNSDIEPVGLVFGVHLCNEEKEDEPTLGLRMRNFNLDGLF